MKLPSSSKKGANAQNASVTVGKLQKMISAGDNTLKLIPEDAEDVRSRFGHDIFPSVTCALFRPLAPR